MIASELSNIDVALFALHRLGGAERPVDTEEIALECWKLVPQKFSWKKYPQYPESEPARSALFDAAKPKHGKLVRGNKSKTGWMLTVAGVDYVRRKLPLLQNLSSEPTDIRARRQEVHKLLVPLERSAAFKKFAQGKSCKGIERHEFAEALRCPVDASPSVMRSRVETLKTRAKDGNREDLLEFLEVCEQYFGDMLTAP